MLNDQLKAAKANPMFTYLAVLVIATALGFQGWRTLLNNFAVEQAGIDGRQMGILQSVREIPGFLALLVVYVTLFIKEHRLAAISVIVLGFGVSLTGVWPSFWGLILSTIIMSLGFHYFETVNQSLVLQYFDKNSSAWVLGKMRSYMSASNIFAGLGVLAAVQFLPYRSMFFLVAIPVVVLGLWMLTKKPADPKAIPQRKKLVVRKRYWLYYALSFLSGARRQIFVAFAVFLLVQKFHFSVTQIAVLFVFNNILNFFFAPWLGKLVLKFGEKPILFFEYGSLVFVFIGYALTKSPWVAAILYVLDNLLFSFSIAIKTYFQKIADPRDLAPSVAFAFTINHMAAVVMPAALGILWMFDYRIPFFIGAGLAIGSLVLVGQIKSETYPP